MRLYIQELKYLDVLGTVCSDVMFDIELILLFLALVCTNSRSPEIDAHSYESRDNRAYSTSRSNPSFTIKRDDLHNFTKSNKLH